MIHISDQHDLLYLNKFIKIFYGYFLIIKVLYYSNFIDRVGEFDGYSIKVL